jgi:N-acetylglucosamine-6-sulfatase
VVVLVDDMRWDEYGMAGHAYIKTPTIDRIAKEGVTFKNAFCATPLCSPSRASFLTGQYVHTNGIIDNTARDERSHQLHTFPRILHGAGYRTAFIGKWHMGNDDSPRPGFDLWVSMQGQGEAIDPNLNINGRREQVKGYVTDVLTDYSLQFVRQARSEPFLLYLSHKALHPNIIQQNDGSTVNIGEGGYIPADRHKGMYRESLFERRPNHGVPPIDKPALMRQIGNLIPLSKVTELVESTIRDRAEMLMAVDESLGKIIAALKEEGKLDNTVVVFTSDHGFWY